jgi:C4-dicarboxylate-specific signal transduction histidine kinase
VRKRCGDITRLTRASRELKRESIRLGKFIDSAIEALELLFFSRRDGLRVHCQDSSLLVQGDAVRLMERLVNPLTHAASCTEAHRVVRVRQDRRYPVVDVVDDGSAQRGRSDRLPARTRWIRS